MKVPILKQKARILRSKTIKGFGYKIRMQYKRGTSELNNVGDFILIRWLDPKTEQTVMLYNQLPTELKEIELSIKEIVTLEQLKTLLDWVTTAKDELNPPQEI